MKKRATILNSIISIVLLGSFLFGVNLVVLSSIRYNYDYKLAVEYCSKTKSYIPFENEINAALKEGLSSKEIADKLSAKFFGIDQSSFDQYITSFLKSKINIAIKVGYSELELKDYFKKNNYNSEVIDNAFKYINENNSKKELDLLKVKMCIKENMNLLQNLDQNDR